MGSGPVDGLRYMSCKSGENGNLQKAKGTDLYSMSYSTGGGHCFPNGLTLAAWASQRTMAKTRVEVLSASENCIPPNSS